MPLTPAQRSLRGRIGAHRMHALHDPVETTRAARAASPATHEYWLAHTFDKAGKIVERTGTKRLSRAELDRRAAHDREAYFTKLAFASVKSRRAKAAQKRKTS